MGLLFKVDGVSPSSATYGSLSVVMLALCATFLLSWLCVLAVEISRKLPMLARARWFVAIARWVQVDSGGSGTEAAAAKFKLNSNRTRLGADRASGELPLEFRAQWPSIRVGLAAAFKLTSRAPGRDLRAARTGNYNRQP